MITDEEMDAVADKFELYGYSVGFARAIYQLGRQHQRESDASLCENPFMLNHDPAGTARNLALVIRANTGELK